MSTPTPAVPVPAGAALAAAALAAGLLVAPASASAAPADGAPEFTAPAQRAAVQFDAPRQRAPEPAEAAAGSTSDATTVTSLTDPATGLGASTAARIPEEAAQVLIASGEETDSTRASLALWERRDDGSWERTAAMSGRNGGNGWLEDRREGDRTTPAGVFSLSDAGGYLEDPGSPLPYYRDEGLRSGAEAVYGEGYASVFDYVIAIDYNRRTGVAPTENTRPMGWDAGGKIWLHVSHGSPTRGCIALAEEDMRHLITTLDPAAHPHIAMGDAEYLAQ